MANNVFPEDTPGVVDTNNTTRTPLGAGGTFTGEWTKLRGQQDMLVFAFSDQQLATFDLEWSDDGVNVLSGSLLATSDILTSEVLTGGFYVYLDVITTAIAPYYRINITNGATPQAVFEAQVFTYPDGFSGSYLGLSDNLSTLSTALLTRSVLAGARADGTFDNYDITNTRRLPVVNPNDTSTFGEAITGPRVNQVDIQFHEGAPEDLLTILENTGSGSSQQVEGIAQFNSGTDTDMDYQLRTGDSIIYYSAHEIYLFVTLGWPTPPTSAGDELAGGLYNHDPDEGYMIGYQGTDWGIIYDRNGSPEDFIAQADFSEDKLDGSTASRYTRDGVPEAIDLTKMNIFLIKFGWLSAAPTEFWVQNPDGELINFHTIKHPNLRAGAQVTSPNMHGHFHITKVASDATDLEMISGCIGGGIVANIAIGQQPDGDYVSAKADGLADETTTPLLASASYVSPWIDTDGWSTYELLIATDQVSAGDGILVEFTDNTNAPTPTVRASENLTFTAEDVATGFIAIARTTELDGLRVTYTNGLTNQTSFYLALTLRVAPVGPPLSNLEASIEPVATVSQSRSALFAESGATNEYGLIGKGGLGEGLDSHVTDSEPRAVRKPMTRSLVATVDLSTTSQQIDATQLSSRSAVLLTIDPDNNQAVHINLGSSATTASMKLDAGYGVPMTIGNNITIHGRSVAGTQRVYLWQFGEPL